MNLPCLRCSNLVHDRQLLEEHLANLPDGKRRNRGQIDPHLAIARAKIEDAESFEEVLDYLTRARNIRGSQLADVASSHMHQARS